LPRYRSNGPFPEPLDVGELGLVLRYLSAVKVGIWRVRLQPDRFAEYSYAVT